MKIKMKIILFIFALIILVSTIYYIISEFSKLNDDNKNFIENYVDGEKSMYDERVEVLNILDDLSIDDKDLKGKLLEKIMSKDSLEIIKNYNKEQKTEYIKNLHILMKNKDKEEVKSETIVMDDNKLRISLENIEKDLEDIKKLVNQNKIIKKKDEYYSEPLLPSLGTKKIEEFQNTPITVNGWENIKSYAQYNVE